MGLVRKGRKQRKIDGGHKGHDSRLTRDEVRRLFTDIDAFPEWCETCMYIRPIEGGKIVPFKLNPIQLWFFTKYMRPNYKAGYPIRCIILKARQMGFSTLIEAFALWCTLGHEHWNSILVATDSDQAQLIFEMTQRFFDEMPVNELRLPNFLISSFTSENIWFKKPQERVKKVTAKDGEWVEDLNSKIRIASAEKKGALGKAGTWMTVHASEVADWPQLRKSLAALLAACHDVPETSVFLESTAAGLNEFYDMWNHRTIGKLEVPYDWQNVFVPWYWDSKYELDVDGDKQFVNDHEKALFDRIMHDDMLWDELDRELTEGRVWKKLFWRRFTLSHKYQGDEDEFCQYYPSYAEEAFRFSGQSVYKATELARIESEVRSPKWRGNIVIKSERYKQSADFDRYGIMLETQLHPFDYGRLQIWEMPKEHMRYVIGADIAEGRATEGISEDQSKFDFSCGQIFKVATTDEIRETGYLLRQVAVWHGNADPHDFAYTLVALAQFYNHAFLAWEANGVGAALKGPILEHCGYRNIYMREDNDRISRRPISIPGWKTTSRTKPYMVSVGQMLTHNREVEIVCASTLSEMKAFSQVGENKFAAARGHDDREMAKLVAFVAAEPRMAKMKRMAELEKEEADFKVPAALDSGDDWQPGMDKYFGED